MATVDDTRREKREEIKKKLKYKTGFEEADIRYTPVEKTKLEVELQTKKIKGRDPTLNYKMVRPSKKLKTPSGLIKQIAVSQSIQEQQEQQQQQQQQQQVQAPQEIQLVRADKKNYEKYLGYRNLVSIQTCDFSARTDGVVYSQLQSYEYMWNKLRKLTGNHDSQAGTIGYVTKEAAEVILRNHKLFQSGIFFDNLPDGFCLSMTEGYELGDKHEYPRLVLDYKYDVKNPKKNPLTVDLTATPQKQIMFEGSPKQFGVTDEDSFSIMHRSTYPYRYRTSHEIFQQKDLLFWKIRKKFPQKADAFIRKHSAEINYIASTFTFSNSNLVDTLIDSSVSYIRDWTLEEVEKKITEQANTWKNFYDNSRDRFFKYMRAEDPELAKKLINEHGELFSNFISSDFEGLFDIFYTSGCVGLELFLKKFQAVFDMVNDDNDKKMAENREFDDDKSNTFFTLKNTFLRTSQNWMEFISDESQKTFEEIAQLSPRERTWWNYLSASHHELCESGDMNDLFKAFQYFLKEYREIGLKKGLKVVKLPAEFPFIDDPAISYSTIKARLRPFNMKVVMDRILVVMRNSRNFQEQADNLKGLNFNDNDVYYASEHQSYNLVTSEMKCHLYKDNVYGRYIRLYPKRDVDLVVTMEDLIKHLGEEGQGHHYYQEEQQFTDFIYKFLGAQKMAAPIQAYRDAFKLINNVGDPPENLKLTMHHRKYLMFIVAVTTTHERGSKVDISKNVMNLLRKIHPLFKVWQNANDRIEEQFDKLIEVIGESVIRYKPTLPKAPPIPEKRWINLDEIVVLTNIFLECVELQQNELIRLITKHKQEFMEHLVQLDMNRDHISMNHFFQCMDLLMVKDKPKKQGNAPEIKLTSEQIAAEEGQREFLRLKLSRVFAIVSKNNFTMQKAKLLIDTIKEFSTVNRYAYDQMVNFLSILEIDNPAVLPPSIDEIIERVQEMTLVTGGSLHKIVSYLPKNCKIDDKKIRAGLRPPIKAEDIFEKLVPEAKKEGVTLVFPQKDEKGEVDLVKYIMDTLNFVDDKSKEILARRKDFNPLLSRNELATRYSSELLKEELNEHQCKIFDIKEVKEQKVEEEKKVDLEEAQKEAQRKEEAISQLNIMVDSVYYPDFRRTPESAQIEPLKHYSKHIKRLMETLKKVNQCWPNEFPDILTRINGKIGAKPNHFRVRSVDFLVDYIEQMVERFSLRPKFPMELLVLLVEYEEQYEIDMKYLALSTIFGAKYLSRSHMVMLLKLNLVCAANKINSNDFIKQIINQYEKFSFILDRLFKIISEMDTSTAEKSAHVIKQAGFLLNLFENIDQRDFTEKLINLLVKSPQAFLPLTERLAAIDLPTKKEVQPESKAEEKIIPKAEAETERTAEPPPKPKPDLNKSAIVAKIIFQHYDLKEIDHVKIERLTRYLVEQDSNDLLKLYNMKPLPTLETLHIISEGELKKFLKYYEKPEFKYRDLREQFKLTTVIPRIEAMKDLLYDKPLSNEKQYHLLNQMLLVHHYGCNADLPIYLRENGTPVAAKDLTQEELKNLVLQCRTTFKDLKSSPEQKENAQLVFNALLRESMWRITRKFPNSTQMLAVLNAAFHGGHLISEIHTGEGKSLIMAMMAANLWFKGQGAVNVVTSNLELAREGHEEFLPYFDMLGIPASKKLITSQTGVHEYCYDGINYSDKSQIALFIAKQKLDPLYMQQHDKDCVSLCIDEADDPLLIDTSQYRFATKLHPKQLKWMFEPLYKFVTSAEYQNHDEKKGAFTIEQDIQKAKEILLAEAEKFDKTAPPEQKVSEYIKGMRDRQINTWLEAAFAASKLEEKVHYVTRTETRGAGENVSQVSFARILDGANRICEGAEWSHGIHQFLHARLNLKRKEKLWDIPEFEINPETAPIASMSSRDIIEHHQKNGGIVLGVTATPGTKSQLEMLNKEFHFDATKIPTHLPSQRKDEWMNLKNQDERFKLVFDQIHAHLTQNETVLNGYKADAKPQPILVIMGDIKTSSVFYKRLCDELKTERFQKYKDILTTQFLTTSETEVDGKPVPLTEAEVRRRAGVAGGITVTPMFGRGTDVSPRLTMEDRVQNHPNGLFDMIPHLPDGLSDFLQKIGRAGRFGFKGETLTITTDEELNAIGIPAECRKSIEDIMDFVQKQREKSEKTTRDLNKQLDFIQKYFFENFLGLTKKQLLEEKKRSEQIAKELAEAEAKKAKEEAEQKKLTEQSDQKTVQASTMQNVNPEITMKPKEIIQTLQTQPLSLANETKKPDAKEDKEEKKDDNYANKTLRDVWIDCISNMFVIWQRLIPEKRSMLREQIAKLQGIKAEGKDFAGAKLNKDELELVPFLQDKSDLTQAEKDLLVMRRSTMDLIDETCNIWNNFPGLSEIDIHQKHVVVDKLLPSSTIVAVEEVKAPTVDQKISLGFNDVSPAKAYAEHCPLVFTTKVYTAEEAKKRRLDSAMMQLGQVFDMKHTSKMPLSILDGFKKLLTERFKDPDKFPFRRKLIEIFSIGEWSGDENFQNQLQQALTQSCVQFAKEFDAERFSDFHVVPEIEKTQPADINYFAGFVKSLRSVNQKIVTDRNSETGLAYLFTTVATTAKSLLYEDVTTKVDKMIQFIENEPVLRSSRARQEAIKGLNRDHSDSYVYRWCTQFGDKKTQSTSQPAEMKCVELDDESVYISFD